MLFRSIPVSYGGTGANSLTAGGVVIGNGTSAVTTVTGASSGQVLTWNGSTWINATPSASGTVTSVSGTGSGLGFSLSGTVTSSGSLTLTVPSGSSLASSIGAATLSGTNTWTAANTFSQGATFSGGNYVTSTYLNFTSTSSMYLTGSAIAIDISSSRIATFDDSGDRKSTRLNSSHT